MELKPVPIIFTSRLVLRKVRPSDLHHYHIRLTSDPEVAKYMLWNENSDIAHTQMTIQRILAGYQEGTRYHWAIALKGDDTLIGTIALLGFEEARNCCTFAYMLGRDFQGRGYGTEALAAVLRFAFESLGVSLVTADHFEENAASGAAMKKAGMVKTSVYPNKYEKNGTYHTAVGYCLSREDWINHHDSRKDPV